MILLDSSFIVAYLNRADLNHIKALQIVKDIDGGRYGSPAITDYIFDEVVTVMLFKVRNLKRVAEVGEKLLAANTVLRIDEELFDLAWKVFIKQEKPIFSFTDCSSIAVCKANGISNIATFDEDFQMLKEFNIIRG